MIVGDIVLNRKLFFKQRTDRYPRERGLAHSDYARLYQNIEGVKAATGVLSYLTGGAGIWVNYNLMEAGEISQARFEYRTTGIIASWIAGRTSLGAIGGALTSALFYTGENLYDNFLIPAATSIWQTQQQFEATFYNSFYRY